MKILNLKKIYNSKNESQTEALKGISFDLPERGMVFILGKSGSGKSTLLNIMSGLDKADEGSLEICGKNLQELSFDELATYRNTYCGFVFQEYNLIPELNVKENIALALELQGEKQVDKEVSRVLEIVELGGYENRSITTLSGGEKQRVAIARAIIKNPQIIFADEPTGALDEKTGETIFNLLKELSKEKLIVVVTHERYFAECYGERIIELADGQIKANNGKETQEPNESKQQKWHKSRLPVKTAIKIGCSNFKYHPIRFLITIILLVMAFTFFGSCINFAIYNPVDSAIKAMYNGEEYIKIYTYDVCVPDGYIFSLEDFLRGTTKDEIMRNIKKEDVDFLRKNLSGTSMAIYCVQSYYYQNAVAATLKQINDVSSTSDDHYSDDLNGYMYIDYDDCNDLGFTIVGRLPENSNEIAIQECFFNMFTIAGLIEDNHTYLIEEPLDIIGRKIKVENNHTENDYKTITGVVFTDCDKKCGKLHEKESMSGNRHYHEKFIVSEDFIAKEDLFFQYSYVLYKKNSDFDAFKKDAEFIFKYSKNNQTFQFSNNIYATSYYTYKNTATVLRGLFFYVGLIFFVFAFILLINFIAVSIHSQIKQIGTLNSMGASFKEVCKVYLSGSLILSGIVFVLSTIMIIISTVVINNYLVNDLKSTFNLLGCNPLSIIISMIVIVIATLLGTLITLKRMKKFTPNEIIINGQIK